MAHLKPEQILMRGSHADGGLSTNKALLGSKVNPNLKPKYRKGGKVRCRADGGSMMEDDFKVKNPNTSSAKMKHGGRTRKSRSKSREHHFLGALAGALLPSIGKMFGFSEGGQVNEPPKRIRRAMGGAGKIRHNQY